MLVASYINATLLYNVTQTTNFPPLLSRCATMTKVNPVIDYGWQQSKNN
uniref:C-type lectin domain-containing protein n=1 Tax=Parascaris univalens TaxID=6257 RepID=A0A915BWH6_PARUN